MAWVRRNLMDSSDDDLPLADRKYTIQKNAIPSIDSDTSFKESDVGDFRRVWDRFCWNCHNDCNNEVKCVNCTITFHKNAKCIPDVNRKRSIRKCVECLSAAKPQNENFGESDLNTLLNYLTERLFLIKKTEMPDNYRNNPDLVNPITFTDILGKVERKVYKTTHEFLLDIKWMRHSCEIHYKSIGKAEKHSFKAVLNDSKQFLEKCIKEMKELKSCGDCYIHRDRSQENPCRVCFKPHLALWVQYGNFPYWPAKLVRIEEEEQPVLVYFFGDNEIGNVGYSNCYLYSEEDPNIYLTDQYKDGVKRAMKEAEKYIQNIEEKFGPYHYAAPKTKLMKGKIDTIHLDETIPGYRDLNYRMIKMERSASPTFVQDQLIDNNDNDVADDQTNSTMHQPLNKVQDPKLNEIKVTNNFFEKMRACKSYIIALEAEYKGQKEKIKQLTEEYKELMAKYDEQIADNCQLRQKNKILEAALTIKKETI